VKEEKSLHQKFISKLEEKYGKWEKITSTFGNSSFGKVANDLCISSSQFTKLISGVGTEGMYLRSIKNIEQLQKYDKLKKDHKNLKKERERLTQSLEEDSGNQSNNWKYGIFLGVLGLLAGAFFASKFLNNPVKTEKQITAEASLTHPLSKYFANDFQADFDSPYLNESEVQNFCPCSGYEGKWELEKPYYFPLPGSRKPGIYYVAKTADIRFKCSKIMDRQNIGSNLLGFEKLLHEVWVDKKRRQFIPTFFNPETKTYTEAFKNLDFENNPDFEKVAYIHSFFMDQFIIYPDSIVRLGEPCGRYAETLNEDLVQEFELDLKHILKNVIGNMTRTVCTNATNNFCNPNDLVKGESVINFDCLFTINTENLGIGGGYPYNKGYRLVEQNYSDNLLCGCEEE